MLALPFKDTFPIVNVECNLCIYLNNMCKQQAQYLAYEEREKKKL